MARGDSTLAPDSPPKRLAVTVLLGVVDVIEDDTVEATDEQFVHDGGQNASPLVDDIAACRRDAHVAGTRTLAEHSEHFALGRG